MQNNQIPIVHPIFTYLIGRKAGMATAFVRGAQTMNSMFFKPIGRKGFHRKSSSPDMMRERVETESKELKSNKSPLRGEETPWVLDGRTGIYYPKGHENVLESIPNGGGAAVNTQVNWFNDENS